MSRAEDEYVIKADANNTIEGINKSINEKIKSDKVQNYCPLKVKKTDFEMFHLPKFKHFTDHNGYHLTTQGYKIDDYNLVAPKTKVIPKKVP